MQEVGTIFLVTWLAGMTAVIGGYIAKLDRTKDSVLKNEILHGITALGGGILLAAVAFALVPKGMESLPVFSLMLSFLGGGALFCWFDWWIQQQKSSVSQFVAMLADYIPEAISLGAVFATNPSLGYYLAAFIAAQNLPEGFNAYRELAGTPHRIGYLFVASILGPIAALAGYYLLQDHEQITAGMMTFAGGGILYLVFQDIAPQAKLQRHWIPALGAVIGFHIGMLGEFFMGG